MPVAQAPPRLLRPAWPTPRSRSPAPVATLNDSDPAGATSDYTGQINWGDGTTSACLSTSCTIVAQPSGAFTVKGTHNYRRSNTYTVTIQLSDAGGSAATTTTTITVT